MRTKTLHAAVSSAMTLAFASACLLPNAADAAGLGKLTVLSALGQPLRAEIELTSISKDDAGNIVTKLASQDAYRQANVEYNPILSNLKFTVESRGGRQVVVVTSNQAVNEPFLEILIELDSSSGRLTREYSVLLDPVEMQSNSAAASSSNGTTVSSQPATSSVQTTPSSATPTATATPAGSGTRGTKSSATSGGSAGSGTTYQVQSGDTLGKIANEYKPSGVSLEQMLVALQRSNPSAFIDNNMNLLRSGRVLNIPDSTEIERTSASEAKQIVIAATTDFNSYRNRLAGQVEQARPEKAIEPKKSEGGKITAKVQEAPTAASESKDKLKLSKAQQQEQADAKAKEEERIAKQRALETANQRIKELETNTAKLQGLLDLKNKNAADAKAKAAAKDEKLAAASAVTPPAASSLPTVQVPAPAASKPAAEPAKPVAAVPPAPVVAPAPAPGFDWKKYLPYGALGLAVLGLVGVVVSKRKKKADTFDDDNSLTASSIKTNSLFGSTGGQSVDTNNSVFNSNFAPSASQLDANEVDPVAEADVYIAYGRDEQAEEILKEALRTQPDRQAVRVKLLEIYAHRKDVRAFENIASELYGMTGGEGPEWAQAASLGVIIDPQNPMYAGGHSADQAPVLGASTLPVENLDPEALLGNSLSKEMLDSISAKDDSIASQILGDAHEDTQRNEMSDGLDFDLGLGGGAAGASGESAPAAAPAPNIDEFGSFAAVSAPADEGVPIHDLSTEAQGMNHSFDETMNALSFETVSKPAAKESDAEGGADFAALDFDLDMAKGSTSESPKAGTFVMPEEPMGEEIPSDVPSLDVTHITAPIEGETAAKHGSGLDYDLSGIDLDLSSPASATQEQASPMKLEPSVAAAGSEEGLTDLSLEADMPEGDFSAEMATKLDLAIAYQEIGDKEGARELLEEVIKGGSGEQITRAKTLMQELG